jgi:FkbM family methyltransferase
LTRLSLQLDNASDYFLTNTHETDGTSSHFRGRPSPGHQCRMNVFRILLWPWRNYRRHGGDSAAAPPPPEFSLEQYETLAPHQIVYDGTTEVVYATPSVFTKWRVDSLFTKEPDTIEWIGGFQPGEIFVDIGANVGMYTIWAAKTRGVRTFAFEPESQNYALLCRNIVMNGLMEHVVAYCLALSDTASYSLLHLSQFQPGGSCHSFGEMIDHNLEHRDTKLSQGCISTTLDTLVAGGVLPTPNHIKIDVDGLEHKVLAGCRSVLADRSLKSVLVEINTNLEQHRKIIADMKAIGFDFSEQQVARSRLTDGAFKGVGNYVFCR